MVDFITSSPFQPFQLQLLLIGFIVYEIRPTKDEYGLTAAFKPVKLFRRSFVGSAQVAKGCGSLNRSIRYEMTQYENASLDVWKLNTYCHLCNQVIRLAAHLQCEQI